MNRLLPVLGVIALGGMTWYILSRPGDPPAPAKAPPTQPMALPTTPPGNLPELKLEPDAPPLEPDSLETVQVQGLMGQGQKWLPQLMAKHPHWTPVKGRPNAWKTDRMELRWKVGAAGQVEGAEVLLVPDAYGGELTALSTFFVGNQDALPLTLEVSEPEKAAEPIEGSFESSAGVKFYYRGAYRTTGEPPFGPERFEISRTPFEGQ